MVYVDLPESPKGENQRRRGLLHGQISSQDVCQAWKYVIYDIQYASLRFETNMRWHVWVQSHSPGFRRDKYQPKIKEYWVDVATTGSYTNENEESFTERTTGEGAADSFELGLAPAESTARDAGDEPEEVTDMELDDDGEDNASSRSKIRVPGKQDLEEEHTLEAGIFWNPGTWSQKHVKCPLFLYCIREAIENVSTVMANMLRVQSKMETARDKLAALGTKECLENSCST